MLRRIKISDRRATSAASTSRVHPIFILNPERINEPQVLGRINEPPVPNLPNYNLSSRQKIIQFASQKRILLPTFGVAFFVLIAGIAIGLIGSFGSIFYLLNVFLSILSF